MGIVKFVLPELKREKSAVSAAHFWGRQAKCLRESPLQRLFGVFPDKVATNLATAYRVAGRLQALFRVSFTANPDILRESQDLSIQRPVLGNRIRLRELL